MTPGCGTDETAGRHPGQELGEPAEALGVEAGDRLGELLEGGIHAWAPLGAGVGLVLARRSGVSGWPLRGQSSGDLE